MRLATVGLGSKFNEQIDDPHRATRRAVFSALGRLGGEKARASLVARRPREDREELREDLDRALSRLDRPDNLEKLAEELEELMQRNRKLERRLSTLETESKGRRMRFEAF